MKIKGLKVVDAARDAVFEITPTDIQVAHPKEPGGCPAARACRRFFGVKEVLIHISRAYVRYDTRWVRYCVPTSLRAEVIAIDRGGRLEPGEYVLKAPTGNERLDYRKPTGPKRRPGKRRVAYHLTVNVRPQAAKGNEKMAG
jgi:hypothetical protein